MNVIFLDIDGVIATPTASLAYNKKLWCIDPTLAALLKRICIECDAKLVISSTWRIGHTWNTFSDLLTAYHLEQFLLTDKEFWCTPRCAQRRGDEIDQWFKDYHSDKTREGVVNWVILDDDSDFTEEQIENNFVKTDYRYGLDSGAYRLVREILTGNSEPSLFKPTYK